MNHKHRVFGSKCHKLVCTFHKQRTGCDYLSAPRKDLEKKKLSSLLQAIGIGLPKYRGGNVNTVYCSPLSDYEVDLIIRTLTFPSSKMKHGIKIERCAWLARLSHRALRFVHAGSETTILQTIRDLGCCST